MIYSVRVHLTGFESNCFYCERSWYQECIHRWWCSECKVCHFFRWFKKVLV